MVSWHLESCYPPEDVKDIMTREFGRKVGFHSCPQRNKSDLVYDTSGGGTYVEAALFSIGVSSAQLVHNVAERLRDDIKTIKLIQWSPRIEELEGEEELSPFLFCGERRRYILFQEHAVSLLSSHTTLQSDPPLLPSTPTSAFMGLLAGRNLVTLTTSWEWGSAILMCFSFILWISDPMARELITLVLSSTPIPWQFSACSKKPRGNTRNVKLGDPFPFARAFSTMFCNNSNKRRMQILICRYLTDLAPCVDAEMIYSVASNCTNLSTQQSMQNYSFDQSEADTFIFSAYAVLRKSGYTVIDAYVAATLSHSMCVVCLVSRQSSAVTWWQIRCPAVLCSCTVRQDAMPMQAFMARVRSRYMTRWWRPCVTTTTLTMRR